MNDLLILCYHAVSEGWPTEFAVSPRSLDAQLRFLLRRGYRPATLSDGAGRRRPAGKTLVVTFDDAYRSVFERGLPVLARLGAPATVFVPTAFAGSPERASWAGMGRWAGGRHLRRTGLHVLGATSAGSLSRGLGGRLALAGPSPGTDRSLGNAELEAELGGSRGRCEKELQRPCQALRIPSPAMTGG